MIEIHIDEEAIKKAERLLETVPNGFERAMVSAFNRALQQGRTAGTREATKLYTLKSSTVRETMAMHRASKNDISAALVSRGPRLALKHFAHKPTYDTTGANRQQIRVAVRKGAMKPIGQGFIYRGMVMQRLGAPRLPIQQKFSLAVPNILEDDAIAEKIQETMGEAVEKRLEHETYRLLAGYGK